jgi:hypothetical protein
LSGSSTAKGWVGSACKSMPHNWGKSAVDIVVYYLRGGV